MTGLALLSMVLAPGTALGQWSGTNPVLIKSNVGIGTTNLQSLLSVNGTINAKEIIVTKTGWSDYVFWPVTGCCR